MNVLFMLWRAIDHVCIHAYSCHHEHFLDPQFSGHYIHRGVNLQKVSKKSVTTTKMAALWISHDQMQPKPCTPQKGYLDRSRPKLHAKRILRCFGTSAKATTQIVHCSCIHCLIRWMMIFEIFTQLNKRHIYQVVPIMKHFSNYQK